MNNWTAGKMVFLVPYKGPSREVMLTNVNRKYVTTESGAHFDLDGFEVTTSMKFNEKCDLLYPSKEEYELKVKLGKAWIELQADMGNRSGRASSLAAIEAARKLLGL